jgi:hypothetical protein
MPAACRREFHAGDLSLRIRGVTPLARVELGSVQCRAGLCAAVVSDRSVASALSILDYVVRR